MQLKHEAKENVDSKRSNMRKTWSQKTTIVETENTEIYFFSTKHQNLTCILVTPILVERFKLCN